MGIWNNLNSWNKADSLLELVRTQFTDEEIINEMSKWMGVDDFIHFLEDIIEEHNISDVNSVSESFYQFQEWYDSLPSLDKAYVDEILVSIELDDVEHMTDEELDRIHDIFDFMHEGE